MHFGENFDVDAINLFHFGALPPLAICSDHIVDITVRSLEVGFEVVLCFFCLFFVTLNSDVFVEDGGF